VDPAALVALTVATATLGHMVRRCASPDAQRLHRPGLAPMIALILFTATVIVAWLYTLWTLHQAFRRQRERDLAADRGIGPMDDAGYRALWQHGEGISRSDLPGIAPDAGRVRNR